MISILFHFMQHSCQTSHLNFIYQFSIWWKSPSQVASYHLQVLLIINICRVNWIVLIPSWTFNVSTFVQSCSEIWTFLTLILISKSNYNFYHAEKPKCLRLWLEPVTFLRYVKFSKTPTWHRQKIPRGVIRNPRDVIRNHVTSSETRVTSSETHVTSSETHVTSGDVGERAALPLR